MAGHRPFRDLAKTLPRPVKLIERKWLTVERTRYKRGTVLGAHGSVGPIWYYFDVGIRHFRIAAGLNR